MENKDDNNCCKPNVSPMAEHECPHCKAKTIKHCTEPSCQLHSEADSGQVSCCHHEEACACCGSGKPHDKNTVWRDLIILCVSLVFLVLGFFNWHEIGFLVFYYVNPAWIAVLLCGVPIVRNAVVALAKKRITSSLLISVAMLASIILEFVNFAYPISSGGHAHSYVFAAGEVAWLMALGELIEDATVKKTRSGIERLVSLIPKEAFVKLPDGSLEKRSLEEIAVGDVVVAKAGELVAVDGVVLSGESQIDTSSVSGEYLPVDVKEGDNVFGGTMNLGGTIEISVGKLLKDMTVAKMAELVEEAAGKKAPISRIADRWAGYIVPSAVLLSLIVGLVSSFVFDLTAVEAIVRATTVLVVFCPCSLALATPTAVAAGLGRAAKNGVLIKSGASLETMSKISVVCFDKTGTLTEGKIMVSEVAAEDEKEFLKLVASVEKYSEHPLAAAVVAAAGSDTYEVAEHRVLQGVGVSAIVNEKNVLVSSLQYAEDNGISVDKYKGFCDQRLAEGKTVVVGVINGICCGAIAFSDMVREGAPDVIRGLADVGIESCMLTGDNSKSAAFVAEQCGVSNIKAALMPEQKLSEIAALQAQGKKVCMIGDGINDAPSLKAADCSVAMGAFGSDIAIDTADMAILNSDLHKLNDTVKLSRRTLRTIKRNILISMSINLLAVVASLMGWLTPVTGALVHNCTSVLVVASSALLLYTRKKNKDK